MNKLDMDLAFARIRQTVKEAREVAQGRLDAIDDLLADEVDPIKARQIGFDRAKYAQWWSMAREVSDV